MYTNSCFICEILSKILFFFLSAAVRSCPEGFFCFAVKFNKVFYKAKNLPASHPFQTGKQTDFFLYSATIFCSQTPFLTRTNPITHLIRSTDITIK